MKTLIFGLGAFGFPVINHLAKNNKNQGFFAYEAVEEIRNHLIIHGSHPFFYPGSTLEENIHLVTSPLEVLADIQLIILALPNQFVRSCIENIREHLMEGVIILNLSKGIDNTTLKTVSSTLEEVMAGKSYTYAVLSGGMIAKELLDGAPLGADIGVSDMSISKTLYDLFASENLIINTTPNYKSVELSGAMKNIFALYTGYIEGKGYGYSTIGLYFSLLYKDVSLLMSELGAEDGTDFSQFSLGGDLIATCFGDSRNRMFGRLVGGGETPLGAYTLMKEQKKHAEGYETLKGIQTYLQGREDYTEIHKIISIFL